MKPKQRFGPLGCVLLLVAFFSCHALAAPSKPIRLRNEHISVPAISPAERAAQERDPTRFSGLFLIQFSGVLSPNQRTQLQELNVDLLRYVPDDAWVARLNGVPAGQLRQLEFVRWVGPYRPEHKVHRQLLARARATLPEDLEVAILMTPRATDSDAAATRGALSSVLQESNHRGHRILRGRLNAARLDSLARSDAVLWIEPARPMRLFDEVSSRIVAGDGGTNLLLTQSLGFDGAGVTVAVADSGLDSGDPAEMHPDIAGRVSAVFHYGTSGQLLDGSDEHSHGTHVAGIIAGNGALGEVDENGFLYGLGVAPGASLIGQRIFDGSGNYAPPPSFERLTRDARRGGAEIGSNSWGDDTEGRYDISAMEFDALVRDADGLALGDQAYILEFSAGNAGPSSGSIGSPAVAKNVIATGAANSDRLNLPLEEFAIYAEGPDSMADFSSRGPCEDGRIKPDVVAPGSWIASLRSIFANDAFAWWPISDNYLYQGGTSQAGPHVSGAAAVFVQFYRSLHGVTPSPALVKAALINSAADMDDPSGTTAVPNMDEGWGRVDLPALVASDRDYDYLDQTILLTNNAVYEKRILVESIDAPLRITLAYTDEPGLPAAAAALVNDLDLEVESPTGRLYRGNLFANGESIPDLSVTDAINNVEAVHLSAPAPGEYILRVRATRVIEDARLETPAPDQDFALVISSTFGNAGTGIVTLDRDVYRAPDVIRLSLVDYDLAGQSSVPILVRSASEPSGELVNLQPKGSWGAFTGAVVTVSGPAAADGMLQVNHGAFIEAVYSDAAPAENRVASAAADLVAPAISNLRATNLFGQVTVMWQTDEAARAVVFYGTNVPGAAVTNIGLELDHSVSLPALPSGVVLNYFVVAEDEAGNRSTNNNGGQYFAITNIQSATVLLIDSFRDLLGLLFPPPLSGYTDALDAAGIPYAIFDATSGAEPTLAQLQSYRCVLWRISDLEAPSPTLSQNIRTYVNNGGALMIASMEAVTRFTEGGLASFNRDILQVESYVEDQVVDLIAGFPGDPVGAGIHTNLNYDPYAEILAFAGTTDPSDWITPSTNAAPVMLSEGEIVGVRAPKTGVDLPGRVVFLSFPLDAVPMGTGLANNRAALLLNAMNFLAPAPGRSTLTLDSDVYSVPGLVIAEVEDLDLSGQGTVTVTARTLQQTNDILVTLTETVRPGLFRGSFLLSPTNTTALGMLFAESGDTVEVRYVDASAGENRLATGLVETEAPVISTVSVEPGYLEAIVSWTTSEPADGLVQYGESPVNFPINRVAYDSGFKTYREVVLSGLRPNQTYYFRVASRDRAGNAATNSELFSFTTLDPKPLPWEDDAEEDNPEWFAYAPEESESIWTRGVPGQGESAHSPTNAWGSNLDGGPVGVAETYLVGPGVLLTGGNRATLSFWHNYDFTPRSEFDLELAAVEIITNVFAPPQLLWQLPDASASEGWEKVTIDLTPHLGQVVYIVWYYFLFSTDSLPRTGWLVDDISVSVTNVQEGTLVITNNLMQAVFAISGQSGYNGSGFSTVISNAPAGDYTIEFGDVIHYQTPALQMETLEPGGQLVFEGNYTFIDANSNGIPDSWEHQHFGGIDPARSSSSDTDLDGLSDAAEFYAGTDPNNPPPPVSVSALRLGSGGIQLSWRSVSNHLYRVHQSTNLVSWSAISGWFPATGTNTTYEVGAIEGTSFFRIEAQAPSGPTALPGLFKVGAVLQSDGSLLLNWPSALGHGYRVWSSADFGTWAPHSDWIRATTFSTLFTNAPSIDPDRLFFRVEAMP